MKSLFLQRLISLLLALIPFVAQGQTINGPSQVCAGTTVTYSVSGLLREIMWSATGGTIIGDGEGSTVSVYWGSSSGRVTVGGIKDKWGTSGSASKNVSIMSGGSTGIGPASSLTGKGSTKSMKTSDKVSDATIASVSSMPILSACGSYSGMVTLSNYVGPILRWERSYDQSSWEPIIHTGNTLTFHATQTTWYRAVIGNAYCTRYSTSSIIYIMQAPVVSVTGNQRCGSGNIELKAHFPDAEGYRWYTAPSGGSVIATGASYTPFLSSTTTYWVSAVKVCEGLRVPVTAVIHSIPSYPYVGINEPVYECGRTTVTVPLQAPAGYTYYWQTTDDPTRTDMPTSSPLAMTSTGFARFNMRDNTTGCFGPYDSRFLEVHHTAPQPTYPRIDSEECFATILDGRISSVKGVVHYWQTQIEGTSTANPERYFRASESRTYYVRANFPGTSCWSASTPITVSIARTRCIVDQSENFVTTHVPQREGITSVADLSYLQKEDNAIQVSYVDGLGRPIQEIMFQGSVSGSDQVQLKTYDSVGRESRLYLPYSSSDNSGKKKSNATNEQLNFYTDHAQDQLAVSQYPWAETVYESSPLERVKERGADGEDWQPGRHTIKTKVMTNPGNEVRRWEYDYATGVCHSPGYYEAGTLTGEEKMDEHGYKHRIFKDHHNHVVLSQHEMMGTVYASTYYVYDDFSQLRMIIQPEGVEELRTSASWALSEVFVSRWCFVYAYDGYGRKVMTRAPGAEAIWYVYNKRDQMILSQNGEQRKRKEWTFTKYDALGRAIMIGLYTHTEQVSVEQMQALADTTTNAFESRTSINYSSQYGYTWDQSFPRVTAINSQILKISYYDHYDYDLNASTSEVSYIQSGMTPEPVASAWNTGKLTGSRVAVPGTSRMLLKAHFYNKRGQLIQTQQDNHLNGKDVLTFSYDFTGKLLQSCHHHTTSYADVKVTKTYRYDHGGRLLEIKHQVNNGPVVTMVSNSYNEIGQLIEKKLHRKNGGVYLQKIDMRYNIRGWLTKINDRSLSESADLFGMELVYNEYSGLQGVPRQYNGNIAEVLYNDRIAGRERGYGFRYDEMNRLLSSEYVSRNDAGVLVSGAFNEGGIQYDLNGNIRTMIRYKGEKTHALNYAYDGNRLMKLTNAVPGNPDGGGLPDKMWSAASPALTYGYDANGNMVRDDVKQVRSIHYNHFNLVEEIVMSNGGKISYAYNGEGVRLTRTVTDSAGGVTTRQYVLGFEYNQDMQLQFFSTEEGRVVMTGATPEYQYYLKDHLGNVRVTFTSQPQVVTEVATFEADKSIQESSTFDLRNASMVNHRLFDHTREGSSSYALRLNGKGYTRVGASKSLAVMSGDVVRLSVFAKYVDADRTNWNATLTNVMSAIATGGASTGTVADGGLGITGSDLPIISLLDKGAQGGRGPKAYLNYLVFDVNLNVKDGGFVRVSAYAKENGSDVLHDALEKEISIAEPGFVYTWLSNENETPVDVYFDDFSVEHIPSMIVHGEEYYPFGMCATSFSRENTMEQRYHYSGKERQTEFNLNWDDFGARMYNPEIGRWNGVDPLADTYFNWSPYHAVKNNPVRNVDVDGRKIVGYLGSWEWVQYGKTGETFKQRTKEFEGKVTHALNHLLDHGAGLEIIEHILTSDVEYTIREGVGGSFFNPYTNEITWDPYEVSVFNTGYRQSPAEALLHEFGHAYKKETDPVGYEKGRTEADKQFGNKEERRNSEEVDNPAAVNLGKIKEGKKTRTQRQVDEKKLYSTGNPTSVKKDDKLTKQKEKIRKMTSE